MIQSFFGIKPEMFFALIVFSVFLYQQVRATNSEQSKDEEAYAAFEPSEYFSHLEYELVINTDVTSLTARHWGTVFISMKCIKKTNEIFLDQKLISINAKTLEAWKYSKSRNNQEITVLYGRNVSQEEGYKIKLKEHMEENVTYKIGLEFSKSIHSMDGFVSGNYRSTHPNVRHMLYTRMKRNYAHHVFPCFDKVEMKAKFKIKIGHLKNVNSFTNTKLVSSELIDNPQEWIEYLSDSDREKLESTFAENKNVETSNNLPKVWVMDEFAKTDFISTFSVALAVGDFNSFELTFQIAGLPVTDSMITKIQIFAEDLSKEQHVREILKIAAQSLAFFSDFFNTMYNLGKLDLIVLPDENITVEDNYGLIYLGEKVVKYVSSESTYFRADRYILVSKICRATSRQWIGHYVSLSTWQEEWFYEGLHTYLQSQCVTKSFHNWKVNVRLNSVNSFINLMRHEERGEDCDPILQFSTIKNFDQTLNPETKSKIYLIIRMLRFIMNLKERLFQKSLSDFINEFKTASASLPQLWNSWTKTANAEEGLLILPKGYTFHSIIESWLFQRGHPLINVSRNKVDKIITVSQKPFTFPDQIESERCWLIPFDVITRNLARKNIRKRREWLTCSDSHLEIPIRNNEKNDWIVISLELHVTGRVQYDPESWSLIQTALFITEEETSYVDSWTRAHLIHDMFTLAEASYLNYNFVFETMKYISHEKKYKCWHVFHRELKRVRSRWSGTSLFKPLQEFVYTLVQPIFDEKVLDIDEFLGKKHSQNMIGKIIVLIACTFEFPECENFSKTLLKDMMSASHHEFVNVIPEFFRESFYCMAMKNADETTWDFLLKKYEKDSTNKTILRALGCSDNTKILKKFLNWSMTESNSIRSPQLSLEVFEILSSSGKGYQLIMPFFKIHEMNKSTALHEIIAAYNTDITIDDYLVRALKGTKKQEDLNVLLKFSNTLKDRKIEKVKSEEEVIRIAKRNISWFEEKEKELLEYFSKS